MNRIAVLLTALGLVLVVALFFVVVFQPLREDLAEVEDQIAAEESQQVQLEQEIARLREVRERAPGVEAELAAADAIVPRDAALPALIRQLQMAADESGMVLSSISTSRPAELPEAAEPGLSGIEVNGQLEGTYFQMVDFLRRIEDPAITPRGVTWASTTVNRADDTYPELQFNLSGRAYAVIEEPLPPEPEPGPDEGTDDAEGDDSDDVDDPDDAADPAGEAARDAAEELS